MAKRTPKPGDINQKMAAVAAEGYEDQEEVKVVRFGGLLPLHVNQSKSEPKVT